MASGSRFFRPLGVVYFCLWGLVLGFWESILSLWGRFWDSLCSDLGECGCPFWNSGSHFSPKRKMYVLSFDAMPLGVDYDYGPMGDNFCPP